MKRVIVALVTIASVLLFAGCGQSGPLYLPGNPSQIQNAPPDPADAEEQKEEGKEKDSDAPTG